eukprot:TRINITY_DN5495_c0_g1_i12.p1 TRINITY_DN5495_c0_g1~~TRINITY_DN5495_c0_g1_i12.p1  ORF type:complete len:226 (+),score=-27.21 TRINITY_DN5495_c0_g1_i12:698-1375(+)
MQLVHIGHIRTKEKFLQVIIICITKFRMCVCMCACENQLHQFCHFTILICCEWVSEIVNQYIMHFQKRRLNQSYELNQSQEIIQQNKFNFIILVVFRVDDAYIHTYILSNILQMQEFIFQRISLLCILLKQIRFLGFAILENVDMCMHLKFKWYLNKTYFQILVQYLRQKILIFLSTSIDSVLVSLILQYVYFTLQILYQVYCQNNYLCELLVYQCINLNIKTLQ